MEPRYWPLVTLAAGLALGAGAVLWLRPAPPAPALAPADGIGLAIPLDTPAENPQGLPRNPPEGLLPPEAETHPQYFEDLAEAPEEAEPESLPAEVDFARLDKLAVTSEVPHRTVGAWDESPESPDPGRRRALVLVVDPGISDAALETLARDVRVRHADARILSVRIYDSEKGARRAGWVDGGALAHQHLVAHISLNEALGLDVIRIRGRVVEP